MNLTFEIFFVGLILSADSFTAALAMGLRPFNKKDAIKFAASSGGAEGLVALIGSMAGAKIISQFSEYDHWIAFILLMGISLHMAYEGIKDLTKKEVQAEKLEFHSFTKILLVSFATSLDAFGVGISLGISHKPILPFIVSIILWAFTTTILGLYLAKKMAAKFGPIISFVGAFLLGIIAFQMLKI